MNTLAYHQAPSFICLKLFLASSASSLASQSVPPSTQTAITSCCLSCSCISLSGAVTNFVCIYIGGPKNTCGDAFGRTWDLAVTSPFSASSHLPWWTCFCYAFCRCSRFLLLLCRSWLFLFSLFFSFFFMSANDISSSEEDESASIFTTSFNFFCRGASSVSKFSSAATKCRLLSPNRTTCLLFPILLIGQRLSLRTQRYMHDEQSWYETSHPLDSTP